MIKKYIEENTEIMYKTLKELCLIPAPSHHEEKRAEYCKKWLEDAGAENVYIDDALNVIFPLNCENSSEITVFVAHTDTVFPDTEPMPYYEEDGKVFCPGVGDDTASAVVLMLTAKYFIENKIKPEKGVLFVLNSCEEGLGNLKGTRQIFKDFEGRIAKFISFDSNIDKITDECVGSHRYEVEVTAEGGHSYLAFGNTNAINEISKIVTAIYNIDIPEKENAYITYNVGEISGGTSVNTIAQSAKILCEYRSNDYECLEIMGNKFNDIFNSLTGKGVAVKVSKIGDRPCANIDDGKIEELRQILKPLIEEIIGKPTSWKSSSTDCNIPLSLGIPAICIGVYSGGNSHKREEWIEKASLVPGLEVGIKAAAALTGVEV